MEKVNTIEEIYTLPSLGKIYSQPVVPQVSLRSMTTAEEMKRLSVTEYPYRLMSEIIKDCLLEDIGIHPYDLCLGDYLFILHRLRAATYGESYELDSICPYCGHKNHETIQLIDLPKKIYDDEIMKYFKFKLPKSGQEVEITYQTPRMLDNISQMVKDYQRRSKAKDIEPTLMYTVASLVKTIDGEEVNSIIKAESWARNLPMLDTQTILAHSDKINNEIGLDVELEEVCDVCRLSYTTAFRSNNEFFRPSLDI